ncbi:hypothetical protein PRUPE_1G052800 [Prunus persica]|uniref:Uncharacterized protein n=1 Tax=Prunus persica TaxID=3760 RepID=A0A251QST5_PRUPE|nr:hypothetical protein PRUPE_1G052800 [Prunus persica]
MQKLWHMNKNFRQTQHGHTKSKAADSVVGFRFLSYSNSKCDTSFQDSYYILNQSCVAPQFAVTRKYKLLDSL